MTEAERKAHALRIANETLEGIFYSDVHEDEALEDATEEDWQAIYEIITTEVQVSID